MTNWQYTRRANYLRWSVLYLHCCFRTLIFQDLQPFYTVFFVVVLLYAVPVVTGNTNNAKILKHHIQPARSSDIALFASPKEDVDGDQGGIILSVWVGGVGVGGRTE